MSDNPAGAATAVRHLHELGHRRIATITGLLDTKPGVDRLRGYREECQRLGLGYRDEYVTYGDYLLRDRARPPHGACSRSTSRRPRSSPPPDMMAIGVIRAAAEAGARASPATCRSSASTTSSSPQHMHPPLTTLAQDKTGLGVAAARALLRQIEGADAAEPVTLPVELIVRGSTARTVGR